MSRRPLGDVVAELAATVQPDPAHHAGTRVTGLAIDIPIEVELRDGSDAPELLGDLPRWRWRSAFDRQPGRLSIELSEAATGGAAGQSHVAGSAPVETAAASVEVAA